MTCQFDVTGALCLTDLGVLVLNWRHQKRLDTEMFKRFWSCYLNRKTCLFYKESTWNTPLHVGGDNHMQEENIGGVLVSKVQGVWEIVRYCCRDSTCISPSLQWCIDFVPLGLVGNSVKSSVRFYWKKENSTHTSAWECQPYLLPLVQTLAWTSPLTHGVFCQLS